MKKLFLIFTIFMIVFTFASCGVRTGKVDRINLTYNNTTVSLESCKLAKYEGQCFIIVKIKFTNNTKKPLSFNSAFMRRDIYQKGKLVLGLPDNEINNKLEPTKSTFIKFSHRLEDFESPVTLKISNSRDKNIYQEQEIKIDNLRIDYY